MPYDLRESTHAAWTGHHSGAGFLFDLPSLPPPSPVAVARPEIHPGTAHRPPATTDANRQKYTACYTDDGRPRTHGAAGAAGERPQ